MWARYARCKKPWSSHALGSLGKPIATRECSYHPGAFVGDGIRLRAEMRYYFDVRYDADAAHPDDSGGVPYVGQLDARRTYEYQAGSADCAHLASNATPPTLAHAVWRTETGPQKAIVEIGFDTTGRKAWETAPYYEGEKARYTRYEYDAVGRETLRVFGQRDTPGLSVRTIHYNVAVIPTHEDAALPLRVVKSSDELCHIRRDFLDARGNRVLQVVDASDNGDNACDTPVSGAKVRTVFRYDAVGNLVQVVDAHKNVWKFGYDSVGRKNWEFDPDHGFRQGPRHCDHVRKRSRSRQAPYRRSRQLHPRILSHDHTSSRRQGVSVCRV